MTIKLLLMKNTFLKFITVSCSILLTFFSIGQGFQINSLSSSSNGYLLCDSTVELSFSAVEYPVNSGADIDLVINGNNFQPSQFQFVINWGDGTTTNHVGGVSSQGIPVSINPQPAHTYSSPGGQVIIVQVINPQNNSSAIYTLQVSISQCMAYVFAPVSVDCNNDGNVEFQLSSGVPLIFTSSNGQFSDTTAANMVNISGMPPGTYNISVDPVWLNANGYIATVVPQTMNVTGPNTTYTTQILLICQTIPDMQCITGTVFCDENGNGVYDAGIEMVIPNAPVSVQSNGTLYTSTTNQNGYYSFSYNAPNQTPAIVSISPNWLSINGYGTSSFIYTTITTDCSQSNPPVNFALNCAPTPNQGCVSGFVWCDANGDGDFDANELPLSGAPIMLQGSVNNVTVYSDSTGFFLYCGTMLNQTTVIGTINPNWLATHGYTITNPSYTMIFMPTLNTQPVGFGVNCGGSPNTCADLWTTVTPWIGYFQNQTNLIKLNFGNYGPGAPGNYTVTLTFPNGVTPVTSSIDVPGYTISGNTITWNLNSNQTSFYQTDVIYFNVPSGISSGTQHVYISSITPSGSVNDCCGSNNFNTLLQIVGNSYDPNDKNVDLSEIIDPSEQEELTYTIRFQNTGTAPAQDIFIIDTLSSNLDWSTLTIIEASHAMHLIDLGNGVMRFDFPQIWLPDSTSNEPLSHGHVVFKIKEESSNTEGSEIYNTAYIYFDWNPAIITNTTYNINSSLGIKELENDLFMYPNPTSDLIQIQSGEKIESIVLYNLNGTEILNEMVNNQTYILDLSNFSSGLYLIHVETQNGFASKQVIKY